MSRTLLTQDRTTAVYAGHAAIANVPVDVQAPAYQKSAVDVNIAHGVTTVG